MVLSPIGFSCFSHETFRFLLHSNRDFYFPKSKKRYRTQIWDPGEIGTDCKEYWIRNRFRPDLPQSTFDEDDDSPIALLPQFLARAATANRFSLVVTTVNPRKQNLRALIGYFPRVWGFADSCVGRIIGPGKAQFIFQSEESLLLVLRRGPWSFNDWMLTVHRWYPNITDNDMQIISFWVQIRKVMRIRFRMRMLQPCLMQTLFRQSIPLMKFLVLVVYRALKLPWKLEVSSGLIGDEPEEVFCFPNTKRLRYSTEATEAYYRRLEAAEDLAVLNQIRKCERVESEGSCNEAPLILISMQGQDTRLWRRRRLWALMEKMMRLFYSYWIWYFLHIYFVRHFYCYGSLAGFCTCFGYRRHDPVPLQATYQSIRLIRVMRKAFGSFIYMMIAYYKYMKRGLNRFHLLPVRLLLESRVTSTSSSKLGFNFLYLFQWLYLNGIMYHVKLL